MDRAVCVPISNDLLHPFQMVAVKSVSTLHTQQPHIMLPVAPAPTEWLLPHLTVGNCLGYLLNTHKGENSDEFYSLCSTILIHMEENTQRVEMSMD